LILSSTAFDIENLQEGSNRKMQMNPSKTKPLSRCLANIMHDTALMTLITMMVIAMAMAIEKEMSRQTMKSKEGKFKRKAACTWQQWQR